MIKIAVTILAIGIVLLLYSCCRVSGQCSREEEEREEENGKPKLSEVE